MYSYHWNSDILSRIGNPRWKLTWNISVKSQCFLITNILITSHRLLVLHHICLLQVIDILSSGHWLMTTIICKRWLIFNERFFHKSLISNVKANASLQKHWLPTATIVSTGHWLMMASIYHKSLMSNKHFCHKSPTTYIKLNASFKCHRLPTATIVSAGHWLMMTSIYHKSLMSIWHFCHCFSGSLSTTDIYNKSLSISITSHRLLI